MPESEFSDSGILGFSDSRSQKTKSSRMEHLPETPFTSLGKRKTVKSIPSLETTDPVIPKISAFTEERANAWGFDSAKEAKRLHKALFFHSDWDSWATTYNNDQ